MGLSDKQGKTRIKIKRATIKDLKEVTDLFVEFGEFNLKYGGEGLGKDFIEDLKDEAKELLENKKQYIYLLIEKNIVCGFLHFFICKLGDYIMLEDMFIYDSYRNNGYGKLLLAIIDTFSKKYDMPVKVEVFNWNKNAINFYFKNNFKEDSTVLIKE
ncbi:hypothetical protein A3D91_02925 [candidate division WWE3 bacterium RIFCSPHIGHO2_02_FULL_38_14]|uniref:N-acetyltransferase domain-containing protein n=1 Tax=candidate division WWE3 bacterium RIFCSPHIGHO2_02_FULL_38_14 TaxID=1802620 RepID=A0A1F4V857_UNCKA|nr:MAG: hypothetical protein A3D91_02925 [candidate division WWE3 bacterium RIFCSPHIGHO2_02_FULL_38_14]